MIWDLFFNRGKSKDEAKRRLALVLCCERKGIPPSFVDRLRDDLISECFPNIRSLRSKG